MASNMSQTMKIKSVNSNMEVLNKNNPEIFDTSPRPGGFLKVMVPTRSQDYLAVDSCVCPTDKPTAPKKSGVSIASSRPDRSSRAPDLNITTASTTSREFRLKRAIEESDWELTAVDETDTVVGISNVLHDTINMLAVTISSVMMMAANLKVPEDYLNWSQRYLECIKDDDGITPPNVLGLMSEIMKRQDNPDYKSNDGGGSKKGSASKSKDKDKERDKHKEKDKGSKSSSSAKANKSKSGSSSRVRNENVFMAEKPTEGDNFDITY